LPQGAPYYTPTERPPRFRAGEWVRVRPTELWLLPDGRDVSVYTLACVAEVIGRGIFSYYWVWVLHDGVARRQLAREWELDPGGAPSEEDVLAVLVATLEGD
jgi:hypothetical protein